MSADKLADAAIAKAMRRPDPSLGERPSDVISWDINETTLTDGSLVFDVVGTSSECRVTFYCVDERAAERLVEQLNDLAIVGASAERL